MCYLNDSFEGGDCTFYHPSQGHYQPGQPDLVSGLVHLFWDRTIYRLMRIVKPRTPSLVPDVVVTSQFDAYLRLPNCAPARPLFATAATQPAGHVRVQAIDRRLPYFRQ